MARTTRTTRTTLIALAVALALAVATAAAGCSSAGTTAGATSTTAAGSDGPLTLVVAGTGATLSTDRLTVSGASRVTWIADRPERDAGSVAVETLVTGWTGYGFDTSPPNAVVTGASRAGLPRSVAVVLSDPVLDGSTLTFSVSYLDVTTPSTPLELAGASVVVDGTGTGNAGRAVEMEVQELKNALNQEIQRIDSSQEALQSDWENIGLDIAMKVSLDGDFATALDALQTAITQLNQVSDPAAALVDQVSNQADAAVSTLQNQITTVLDDLDTAERAALAAALAAAL
jgi:hypothetical protein